MNPITLIGLIAVESHYLQSFGKWFDLNGFARIYVLTRTNFHSLKYCTSFRDKKLLIPRQSYESLACLSHKNSKLLTITNTPSDIFAPAHATVSVLSTPNSSIEIFPDTESPLTSNARLQETGNMWPPSRPQFVLAICWRAFRQMT